MSLEAANNDFRDSALCESLMRAVSINVAPAVTFDRGFDLAGLLEVRRIDTGLSELRTH